jgi:serine/threonine protein kinase
MKKKPRRAIVEVDLVSRDGRVLLNGQELDLGPLIVHDEIARGANAVVFVATDPVLNRRVAVKIWIALRSGDVRNKAEQGLAESRKTWDAQRTEVAKVYFAGSVNNVFYTVMELIEGSTLHEWLEKEKPSLGARYYVAERIINLDVELQQHGVIHGDLHGGNIMIVEDVTPRSYFDLSKHKRWNIKLLDFGTSTYSGREKSRERHYRVLVKTINQCIAPFVLSELEASPKPESQDLSAMQEWMLRGLYAIRAALYESGREYVGWPLLRSFGIGMLTTQGFGLSTLRARELLEAFISTGTVAPTREAIGETAEWGPFDGRTAKRND